LNPACGRQESRRSRVQPAYWQAGTPPFWGGNRIQGLPWIHTRDLITFSENGEIASRINTDKENERKNQQ